MERNMMIAGSGGQGVMMMGKLLAEAVCSSTDLNVTFFPSYGAEQRGGTANCYVVISDEPIGAPLGDEIDEMIVMNDLSLDKFLPKLIPGFVATSYWQNMVSDVILLFGLFMTIVTAKGQRETLKQGAINQLKRGEKYAK